MDSWIFVMAFTVVTMAPFMARYENPDAEWADIVNDEDAVIDETSAADTSVQEDDRA